MTEIFDIADRYITDWAKLDPNAGLVLGLPSDPSSWTDYSPEGFARLAALGRGAVHSLDSASVASKDDRIARDVLHEWLVAELDVADAGDFFHTTNMFMGPFQIIRTVFDFAPHGSEDDWRGVAQRLAHVPRSVESLRQTLEAGLTHATQPAPRQLGDMARAAEVYSGTAAGSSSFFAALVGGYDRGGAGNANLGAALESSANAATQAYANFALWLREAATTSTGKDAAGPERYRRALRQVNGAATDPLELYEWGWDELHRIESEMAETGAQILPGATIREVVRLLNTDPARGFDDPGAYRDWLQEVHDQALVSLNGVHFDIDPRLMRIECVIPPPGGGLAPYYVPPSEDFERPGRTNWPIGTARWFPRWRNLTTAYHEGVPGHHLQWGGVKLLAERMSRFQRTWFGSGHGEGWALYAERLMAELGYLANPDDYFGMLRGQLFRAGRIVLDVGLHLELPIPAAESFHPGETWSHDLALEFGVQRLGQPAEFMESEVVRYLAQPGQATSYKLGERYWLEAREDARKRQGPRFDLKTFHTQALALGPMGLDQLKREVAALSGPGEGSQ